MAKLTTARARLVAVHVGRTLTQAALRPDAPGVNVLRGRCRCGNIEVTFRTASAPGELRLRACGCSFCGSHDARSVTDPGGSAVIAIGDPRAVRRHRFATATADFLLCDACGQYVAAVVSGDEPSLATIQAGVLSPPLVQAAEPVSYEGERPEERLARRRRAWTPTDLVEVGDAHEPERIPGVRALFEEYQRWLGVDLCFQGFDRELAGLPGDYAPPRGRLLVARAGTTDVACGALRPFEDGVCEMKRLYVRAAFRGTGVGRLLARRLIAEARAEGYLRMRLDTLPSMGEALALYESLGFCEIAPYRENPIAGTRYLELDLSVSPGIRS